MAKFLVVLDDEGGLIIPKSIRDELKLSAGDSFAVIPSERREIVLYPLQGRKKKLEKRLRNKEKNR